MTSWVVSDSGILIATVIEESITQKADALVGYWDAQGIPIAAPSLFRYEIVAVMRKSVYREILTEAEAIRGRDVLVSLPIHLMFSNDLLRRGYELATQLNRPTAYDAQYLAVAEHLDCEFWTADQRLFNTVHTVLPWVKWLGNFVLPESESTSEL